MAGGLGVTLDTTQLDRLAKNLDTNVDRALASLAEYVKGQAADMAPYDTGALSNSIDAEKERELLYLVFDQVEYGIWQEIGTSRIPAQPFMTPAVERGFDHVAKLIGEAIT